MAGSWVTTRKFTGSHDYDTIEIAVTCFAKTVLEKTTIAKANHVIEFPHN